MINPRLVRVAAPLAALMAGLLMQRAAAAAPVEFFVATDGHDEWSGRAARATAGGTNGPFATLDRALKAVRETVPKGRTAAATPMITVASGSYYLAEPVILSGADSHLLIRGAGSPGASILSGGRPLRDWRETTLAGRTVWCTDLPLVAGKPWKFHELWVNGQRATRSRHPREGYLAVAALSDKSPEWTQGNARFGFKEGDLRAWPGVTNAELVVMNRWVESRLPVAQVDEAKHIVQCAKKSVFALEAGDLYYLEGEIEFLDTPGEWCVDAAGRTLYYLPRAGETMPTTVAVAPLLEQVVRLEGKAGQPVEGVRFSGLTFSHSEWCFPEGFSTGEHRVELSPAPAPDVGGFGQAAIGVPGAVWGQHVLGCSFVDCRFENLGDYALELARGCRSNRVSRCEFAALGAGGIKLGETAIRAAAVDQAGGNEVSDCRIHDGGLMFHSAIGVWIGQSAQNRLLRNVIHDFYYTGISIGWTWGYGPALAAGNVVEYNHIHHIGVKSNGDGPILSDMGGIYTLGMQPGTVIRNNLWHDFAGFRYGGWGIYFDEGSSSILAESNVVYRTTHGGFHQHYGATNTLRNNILAFGRDHQIQRTRPEAHLSFSFVTNIVYFDSGPLLGGDLSNDHYVFEHNLYWDARPGAVAGELRVGPCSLAQWRERGHDRESLVLDPLFIAPREGDFRLAEGSPALRMGFHQIDLSRVPGR